ncbi:MAG: hypothetical protein ABL933_19155, partial [Methyloglobulus sp.]
RFIGMAHLLSSGDTSIPLGIAYAIFGGKFLLINKKEAGFTDVLFKCVLGREPRCLLRRIGENIANQ